MIHSTLHARYISRTVFAAVPEADFTGEYLYVIVFALKLVILEICILSKNYIAF